MMKFGLYRSSLPLALLCCLIGSPLLFAQEGHPASTGAGGFVSVKDVGAKGDGAADDTTAIQSAFRQFTQDLKGTGAGGAIYFPPGRYRISQPLILGGVTSNAVHLLGAPGATLSWVGSPDWPMLIVYGSFSPVIEGIRFSTNGSARYAIHLVADNAIHATLRSAVVPGNQTVTPGTMSSIGVGTLVKIDTDANAE